MTRRLAVIAALAGLSCGEKSEEKKPETDVQPVVAAAKDAAPVAVKDAAPVVVKAPAGTTRLGDVPANIAVHFVSEKPLIAAVGKAPVTFASSSSEPLAELVTQLGLATKKRGTITLVGTSDTVDAAAKVKVKPKGRNVDLDFHDAKGDQIADLLRLVGGAKLEGTLGGDFALRVKRIPHNELLGIMAALCTAAVAINGRLISLTGSTCKANPPRPAELEPEEEVFDELGLVVLVPSTDIAEFELVGLSTVGDKPRALVRSPDKSGPRYTRLAVGDLLGAETDLCADAPPDDSRLEDLRKLDADSKRLERELLEMQSGKAGRTIDALKAELDALKKKRDELLEMASKPGPARPECAGRGGLEFRWQVDAIDAKGVRLKTTHAFAKVPPRRLELAE